MIYVDLSSWYRAAWLRLARGVASGGFVLALASPGGAFEVTSCDVLVPRGEIGELRQNLSCSHTVAHCADSPEILCADPGPGVGPGCPRGPCVNRAIQLADRATLRLNGHELRGGKVGVLCRDRCSVEGGGGLIADADVGIRQWSHRTMAVRDLRFENNGWAINAAYFARRTTLTNVSVHDGSGIYAPNLHATRLEIVDLAGCGHGPFIAADRLRGSEISTPWVYVERGLDVTGLTVVAECGTGLVAPRGRVRLVDSVLSGATVADIATRVQPELSNTVCDRSARLDRDGELTGATWGVCGLDSSPAAR